MQLSKRGTIEYFLLSSNKKSRNEEQQSESNLFSSPPLLLSDFENYFTFLSTDNQIRSNLISITPPPSLKASAPANDTSASVNDSFAQPKLPTYPVNHQGCSFQLS